MCVCVCVSLSLSLSLSLSVCICMCVSFFLYVRLSVCATELLSLHNLETEHRMARKQIVEPMSGLRCE